MNPATISAESRKTLLAAPARKLALAWLIIALTALMSAGITAIFALMARMPWLAHLFPSANFAQTSALVQFDLATIISFLSFGGVLWSLWEPQVTFMHRLALVFVAGGCLAVGFSPWAGFSEPLLNNYLPVLRHPLFMGGITLFGAGMLLQTLLTLRQAGVSATWTQPARLAAFTTALTTGTVFLALIWTWWQLTGWDGQNYFDWLFLGGGQILNFTYMQLMVMAWMGLAAGLGVTLRVALWVIQGLLLLGAMPILLVPIHYAHYAVDTPAARHAFITLMQHGGGLLAIPMGMIILYGLMKRRNSIAQAEQPLYITLHASLLFFVIGGLLGGITATLNIMIPAHHDAFTIAVTIALMGLTYHLLPLLGFTLSLPRLALIQLWLYLSGKMLSLMGLIVSGTLGVTRDIGGIATTANSLSGELALRTMEFADLIVALGVMLFVVVVVHALYHPCARRW